MNTDNGSLEFDFYLNNTRLQATALEAEKRIKGISDTAIREGERAEGSFNGMAAGLAAIGGTAFLGMLGSKIIAVTGEFQQLDVAFTTMLGSKEKADRLMAQIVETAAKTPFTLTEVAQGAKQLLAYQVAAEDVNKTVIQLGNLAAGVSVPISRLILVYGQVKAKGKLMGDDLRQFTEAGIPMISELAKSMGVADSEVSKLVENGKVGFKEVQTVIENLTSEGGMFFNLMEKQSMTITGQISNLSDSFDMMLNSIGQGNSDLIGTGISGLKMLVDNYENIGKVLGGLVVTYGAYKAAVMVANAVSIIQREIAYQQILANIGNAGTTITLTAAEGVAAVAKSRLTAAQLALNASMLANPYVLAFAAIVGLTVAIYAFTTAKTEAEIAETRYNEAIDKSNTAIDLEKDKSTSLIQVINNEGLSRDYRNKKLKELIALSPEHLSNLTLENMKTVDGKAAIDAYVLALEKKIKMEILFSELSASIKRSSDAERGKENLGFMDQAQIAVSTVLNPAGGGMTAIELNMKNNSEVMKAEKALQKKLSYEMAEMNGKSKYAGSEKPKTVINASYWEAEVKTAKEALDSLDSKSKTFASDQKKLLATMAKGESEINKIRGVKPKVKDTSKKDTNDYDKALIDSKKQAYSAEQSLIRKGIEEKIRLSDEALKREGVSYLQEQELIKGQIIAKKELIDFDLKQTIKGISEQEKEFVSKAKKAGVKSPSTESFTRMKATANSSAESEKGSIDIINLQSEKQNLDALLKEYQNFEQNRKEINEKYTKDRQRLIDGRMSAGADTLQIDASVAVLDSSNKDSNDALDRQIAEKETIFSGFMDRISAMGLEELIQALADANLAMQNSSGSDESKATMRAKIKSMQDKLRELETNNGKDSKANVISNEGLKKSKKTVEVLKLVNAEIGNAIDSFDGLDDGTKQVMKAALNISSAVIMSISGIIALSVTGGEAIKGVEKASVILAIIGAAIAIVSTLINMIASAKTRKQEAELASYAARVDMLKISYDNLSRSIDKALGGNKQKLQKETIDNLKKQQEVYLKMVSLENSKKKSDASKSNQYYQSIRENANQIEDTINSMREEILGMEVTSAASDLGSAIIDAFAAGEDAAAAWGSKVNDIVGDVIRKMLIQKLVEEPVGNIINKYMAKWVDSEGNFLGFDAVMNSAADMGTELTGLGAGLSTALEGLPDDIKKYLTGDSAANANKTALSGAVKGVSEDTAGVISGQMNAMRINQAESILVLREQLLALNQIATNTANLDGILFAINSLVNGGRAKGYW